MRWLYLVAFACIQLNSIAQEKEVVFSEKGATTNVSEADITNPVTKRTDSLQNALLKNNGTIDSLIKVQQAISVQQVYSQKQWKQFYDSLGKNPLANVPTSDQFPKKEVSEQELIEALNQKFYGAQRDSMARGDALLENSVDQAGNDIPNASDLKLPDDDLMNLSPLRASTIKSKYLSNLDSVRQVNLQNEKIRLTEKEISPDELVSELSTKPSFWDKTYFEGVIGFTPGDFKIIQVSPAIGYHFTQYLSLGLGPNILVQQEAKKVVTTVGLKMFFKAEFLRRQAYFQLEDIMDSYGHIETEEGRKSIFEQHNIFAGGGFLLNMKAPLTLNFSVLYCITESKMVSHEFSPMVFRIGLSSIKTKK